MAILTLELPQPMLDRLNQIAAEKSVKVEVVVRHFVACGIDMYDTALTDEEIDKQIEETFKLPPRPVIDREKIAAQFAELGRLAALGRASEQQKPQGD